MLRIKKEEYDQLVLAVRAMCDKVILEDTKKGIIPYTFSIPKKMVPDVFSCESLLEDVARTLHKDGFRTSINHQSYTLYVMPTLDIDVGFLKCVRERRDRCEVAKGTESFLPIKE